jgi:hypothetical protein
MKPRGERRREQSRDEEGLFTGKAACWNAALHVVRLCSFFKNSRWLIVRVAILSV